MVAEAIRHQSATVRGAEVQAVGSLLVAVYLVLQADDGRDGLVHGGGHGFDRVIGFESARVALICEERHVQSRHVSVVGGIPSISRCQRQRKGNR